ncbi:MAG: PQQ-binding-like beta-propeller repeat protein [Candidatus Sumerlaeota bacterium]|nr:PQQ-binding-like beta-propeller repeat protein [Candidatus Sumerlaeota bacterium]
MGADYTAYNLKTGEPTGFDKGKYAPVGMPHHRCYRDKATENYLLTGKSGIELVSLTDGWQGNNSWIRGTCQYGILPANGLLYAPPNACACFTQVKVAGFFAAAPQRADQGEPAPDAPRLEKGPAYGKTDGPGSAAGPPPSDDWPMYRHDAARSGSVNTSVPDRLAKQWETNRKGGLTQPVAANGPVYVASTDAHTVYALNAADGGERWQFTAGGRIDSSPTVYKGMVLFGSADGWLYCLRASDGELAWRFRGAPRDRLVGAFDQLESAWPIHGTVLIQNDTIYVTAGRSSYLDGGIYLYRLDPATGAEVSQTDIYNLDPNTGKQTGKEPMGKFNMEGVGTDILSGDGNSVFLKYMQFDADGKQVQENKPHLFSMTNLLGEEWFIRSYWLLGSEIGAGWSGWASAAQKAPYGRILSFDDTRVYGYGRKTVQSGPTGHRADAYHLFSMNRNAPVEGAGAATDGKRSKGGAKKTPAASRYLWSNDDSLVVRAMTLARPGSASLPPGPGEQLGRASDRLIVAGYPDVGRKNADELSYSNESDARAALQGEKGVYLRVASAEDGKTLAEYPLESVPVFDGLSAANGRLFLAMKNGAIQCWAGGK